MAETDPTADFLARERAALGDLAADSGLLGVGAAAPPPPAPDDTASRFPALGDDGELSAQPTGAPAASNAFGTEDDAPVAPAAPAAPQAGADMAASLFAADEDADTAARKAAFEDQFPAFNDPELDQAVADAAPEPASRALDPEPPSHTFMFNSGPPMAATPSNPYEEDNDDQTEPEPVRAWRARQADEIAARNATAERLKGETISRAEHDIDTFYEEYNAKKEKTIAKNKYVCVYYRGKRPRERVAWSRGSRKQGKGGWWQAARRRKTKEKRKVPVIAPFGTSWRTMCILDLASCSLPRCPHL